MDTGSGNTFYSQQPAVVRNQSFETFSCIMFFPLAIFFPLDIILYLGLTLLFHFRRRRIFKPSASKYIFNAVEICSGSILLWGVRKKGVPLERLSINKIIKVVARDVYKDDMQKKEAFTVYEFHHRFGQKPLLQYDIDRRDEFEQLLAQSDIEIIPYQ